MNRRILQERHHVKDNIYIEINLKAHDAHIDYATYKRIPKGYSVNVIPVKISGNMKEFGAFTGFNHFIHECKRHTNTQSNLAIGKFERKREEYLSKFDENGVLK